MKILELAKEEDRRSNLTSKMFGSPNKPKSFDFFSHLGLRKLKRKNKPASEREDLQWTTQGPPLLSHPGDRKENSISAGNPPTICGPKKGI